MSERRSVPGGKKRRSKNRRGARATRRRKRRLLAEAIRAARSKPLVKRYRFRLKREGKWFVARCVELNVASQGRTPLEARQNLKEALTLYLDGGAAVALVREASCDGSPDGPS